MKILITGSNGMLGSALVQHLAESHQLFGIGIEANSKQNIRYFQTDIADKNAVYAAFSNAAPDIIIHTAALTNVDGCEQNRAEAFRINVNGTKNIADAARATRSILVFIITDYVFSGKKQSPYLETDAPDPISVYGETKHEAECYIQSNTAANEYLIIRTSWLYGLCGKNFVETILKISETKTELTMVSDHKGSPTYTLDLAQAIGYSIELNADLHNRKMTGIVNISNSGETTWYDFAKEILTAERKNVTLHPISQTSSDRPAKRPSYSVLSLARFESLTGKQMRPWNQALKDYLVARHS
jgi:dTDP-4-dehydrorhamnose reductase